MKQADKNQQPADLFDQAQSEINKHMPLAARMRPRTLNEFIGQEHITGKGKILRQAIENDQLRSAIFYGPPGTGKSSLASVIANTTSSIFENFSAVTSGVADIRKIIELAKDRKKLYSKKTILFVDEIHRFNKAQQDAFLPHVEDGTIILIGATTENPYFEVNSPLISRSRIFKFENHTEKQIKDIIVNALGDHERGLGDWNIEITEDALSHIIDISNGDARNALNALEFACISISPDETGKRLLTLDIAEEALQQRSISYDKNGDNHYDVISAFIKSMRGSDPDAALYWLARMIYAGENPRFIARRIVILASEDIGNADPMAILVAIAAAQAVELIGLPEAQLNLAQAVTYMACAPKSNASCTGFFKAMKDVTDVRAEPVPIHLRDSSYKGAKNFGHGKGYKYPHNYPNNWVDQDYLPENLKSAIYYEPSQNGRELKFKEKLDAKRNKLNKDL